jgi:flagellar hook-basal body complex protein FliE
MSIGALDATSAYGRAMKSAAVAPAIDADADTAAPGASFGGMVENLIGDASNSLKSAESESVKQVAGKGDMIDMVTAIGAAETALETVVAVRDRVVNAYSEIMRMQI